MTERKKFDIAVIGSGPGGYVAAIRAALTGKSVALIESKDAGGTCLNVGCIPTKTLIATAEVLEKVKHAQDFGIFVDNITIDYAKMKERKDNVVEKIRKSLEGLLTAQKVTLIRGYGQFISPEEIKVMGQDNCIIEAEQIIIATGSSPRDISAFPVDGKKVHNSTTILEMTQLPKKLIVIGGGIIGCEFASLYQMLGVKVIILEALPTIVSTESKEIAQTLHRIFQRKGIEIQTNVVVEGIDSTEEGIEVRIQGNKVIEGDIALVAIGRKLLTDTIGLEKAGVALDPRGFIPVNDKMQTNVPHIYAIGDVTAKWLLAHVASHQGIVAAQNACNISTKMHYEAVPNVIYTYPEIATVGYSLEKALEKGYRATVGKFPFQALGKAQATRETEGFAQIVIDEPTGQILGAQVVGYEASSLIAHMTLAIQNELTVDSIVETIHAHPTIAEAWMEAAFIAMKTPIHMPPMTKKPT